MQRIHFFTSAYKYWPCANECFRTDVFAEIYSYKCEEHKGHITAPTHRGVVLLLDGWLDDPKM